MAPVTVLILAPSPGPHAGALVRLLDEATAAVAERHRHAFLAAGAAEVVVRREPADGTPFGARLRRLIAELQPAGLVVLGAGSVPLATPDDIRAFVEAAAAPEPGALANSFYSADAVAVSCASTLLRSVPDDLRTDNALPRWLAEVTGVAVRDVGHRRDLAVDIDSPLDLLLLETAVTDVPQPTADDAAAVRGRLAAVRALVSDPGAELLIAGRVGAADLARVERGSRSRTRALVEERGLRTAVGTPGGAANRRPPRSLLYDLLGRGSPSALGDVVARVSDGALIDSRVLLAARHGSDERTWPSAEDRFASDLLLADRIRDPWLRELTVAAVDAPVPVLLGAHTLVGPAAPFALGLPG